MEPAHIYDRVFTSVKAFPQSATVAQIQAIAATRGYEVLALTDQVEVYRNRRKIAVYMA